MATEGNCVDNDLAPSPKQRHTANRTIYFARIGGNGVSVAIRNALGRVAQSVRGFGRSAIIASDRAGVGASHKDLIENDTNQ